MSIEYGRLDASLCTLFLSRTPALSYTWTVVLPPLLLHALTSKRKTTAAKATKPFLSHCARDCICRFIQVTLLSCWFNYPKGNIISYLPLRLSTPLCFIPVPVKIP